MQGERGELTEKVLEKGEWKDSKLQKPRSCVLGVKLAGIHWYYKTDSHAAELTAGYYNAGRMSDGSLRNGYQPLLKIVKNYGAHLSFTCVEMRDADHYSRPDACCSPEGVTCTVQSIPCSWRMQVVDQDIVMRCVQLKPCSASTVRGEF